MDEWAEQPDHAQRLALSELMHERTLPINQVPARVRQWLVLLENPIEREGLDKWAADRGGSSGKIVDVSNDGVAIWEAHGEFSTVTEIRTGEAAKQTIGESQFLGTLPGAVFRSIEIFVGEQGEQEPVDLGFRNDRLVCCDLFDGAARMWSDYTLNADGTGYIRLQNISLANDEPSRLLQTLIEIGNYRKLALLGFPVARALLPWLSDAEARHADITRKLVESGDDSGTLLPDLLALSAEVEHRAAAVRYRMGATFSYHRLTRDRLVSLRERRLPGYSTAGEFIQRRMVPAMRTCTVADRRLADLGERISRTASLVSLEQGVSLGHQNREILSNLNRRVYLQLRLQTLVEGLSVFAICYYALGLTSYALGGIDASKRHVWLAIATPLVLLATWISLRNMRRRAHADLNQAQHSVSPQSLKR